MAKKDEPAVTEPIPEETLTERQEIFLAFVEGGARYNEAAEEAGVHRVTAWRWRADPAFMKRYEAARKASVSKLKREAERRAMAGSDRLLIFLLCAYAPEEFQERQVIDHRGKLDLANTIAQARKRIGNK
jgi:transposase